MRRVVHPHPAYRVVRRDHRFMTALFVVLGALVFGCVILCAFGLIDPVS